MIMKKVLTVVLVFVLLWGCLYLPEAKAAENTGDNDALRTSVEQQVRTYAKSINQSNADDAAAMALAKHGIFNRSTLNANTSHPLTATLMNAELAITRIIEGCVAAINIMVL